MSSANGRVGELKAFPVERDEKHRVLMDAVDNVRDILEAGAHEGERDRHFAPSVG